MMLLSLAWPHARLQNRPAASSALSSYAFSLMFNEMMNLLRPQRLNVLEAPLTLVDSSEPLPRLPRSDTEFSD